MIYRPDDVPKDWMVRESALAVLDDERTDQDFARTLAKWALFQLGAEPDCEMCNMGRHVECANCAAEVSAPCRCCGGRVRSATAAESPWSKQVNELHAGLVKAWNTLGVVLSRTNDEDPRRRALVEIRFLVADALDSFAEVK